MTFLTILYGATFLFAFAALIWWTVFGDGGSVDVIFSLLFLIPILIGIFASIIAGNLANVVLLIISLMIILFVLYRSVMEVSDGD